MNTETPRMSKEELRERLNEVIVLDVRSETDWDKSNSKIRGAIRETPGEESRWSEKYARDRTYVLYCD